jgi:hypothetical protein
MRLPHLSPSVERRSPTTAPAGPVRGEAVRPQICSLKLCGVETDCNGNGSCTKCNTSMGVCVIP